MRTVTLGRHIIANVHVVIVVLAMPPTAGKYVVLLIPIQTQNLLAPATHRTLDSLGEFPERARIRVCVQGRGIGGGVM